MSARGNAVVLPSPLSGEALLRAVNGIAPEIFVTHARPVDPGFRPRNAAGRVYRYLEPRERVDLARWKAASRLLEGRLDVRSFGRGLPRATPTWRDVDSVRVDVDGPWVVLEIRARSFVWGMVRKVVSALRGFSAGTLTEASIRSAVRGETRLTLPLAEPEGLILWEVEYPEPWTVVGDRFSARQARFWSEARDAAARRAAVVGRLDPTAR